MVSWLLIPKILRALGLASLASDRGKHTRSGYHVGVRTKCSGEVALAQTLFCTGITMKTKWYQSYCM